MRKNLILPGLAFGLVWGTFSHDAAAQGYRETGEKLYASQQRLHGISKAGFSMGTGRLLDNNLRAGSGGYNNDRDVQNIGRATDLGATGNLRGLGNFRGNIGYKAAGEFSGNLGSNDFHGFNARSFGVSDLASVSPGSSGMLGGGPAALQRSGAGVSAGDLSRRNGAPGPTPGGFDSNPYLNNPAINPSLNQGNYLNEFSPSAEARKAMGMTMGNNGNVYEVNASPLKGLTTRQLGGPNKPGAPGQGAEAGQPGSSLLDFSQAANQLEGVAPSTLGDKLTAPPDLNIKGATEGLNKPLGETDLLGGPGGPDLSAIGLPGDARIQQKQDFIDGSMFRSLSGSKIKPGEDPYIDLLRKIQEGQEKPDSGEKPATPGEIKEPVKPEAAEPEPAEEKLEIPPAPPGTIPAEAVEKMVKKLRYRMEAMKSLSGVAENEINQAMKKAEVELAQGRYFDAANSYAEIRAARNNHPLARTGQVHAQIGAGLHLSAAANLRELLLQSPELMSTRYDASLLPAADRLRKVTGDLATGPDEQARERTLLMAYLAYQSGDQESVRKHVKKLVELDPGDALARVLAGVWVDGKKGKAGQDAGAKGGGA